ncbi:putative nepenthesin [Helianthus annuus]|nr:probable aspartyl protease At4g16563 [Helianthus annuus]KAJ0655894.1 putative nepenthesin [Helianthus annuus]KAJ0659571.1 putative nepenthesin [Helianthus annuus]KAJ0703238.1 putative nepenthesin [Helianthus annuus]
MSLSLITIFSLITTLCIPPSSSQTTLKLSLSPIHNPHIAGSKSTNPWVQTLNHLSSSSLARAHYLKHPKDNSSASNSQFNSKINSQIPLFPQSYGAYSVSLSVGSPGQTLSFVMDTGSSLVWFPCTKRYMCYGCDFPGVNETRVPKFIPRLSSSAKIIGCSNKKCGLLFGSGSSGQCTSKEICPAYMVQYGSGSTSGLLLSETLNFKEGGVKDFVVGCSILSTRQPAGIAGFGRGPASLPVQMGLKKFSYCLVSHRFDDAPVSSEMVLVRNSKNMGSSNSAGIAGVSYTKFRENPGSSNSAFKEYYYLSLRKITVGGKTVKIPYDFLVPGSDGNGGTIIDSGTTFTFMDNQVHNLVAKEFESQVSKYKRAADVEDMTGLRPCFNVSGKRVEIPELMFHFKGGAKLALPTADYFSLLGDTDALCMTIVSSDRIGLGQKLGPSIIIGNYQQQNIYVEYDLEKGRLGFKKQQCK